MGFRIILLLLCLASPCLLSAQRITFETGWNPGVVVLKDNTTVKGQINYVQKNETIQVTTSSQKLKYDADQLKFFQYYDKEQGYNRAFIALKKLAVDNPKVTQMFEIVLEGALPYYRKPYLIEKAVVKHNKATTDHIFSDFVEYSYFLLTPDGLVEANNFGNDILPYLKKHIKSISDFIVDNKLDINLIADQIQIVDHYNGLEQN